MDDWVDATFSWEQELNGHKRVFIIRCRRCFVLVGTRIGEGRLITLLNDSCPVCGFNGKEG